LLRISDSLGPFPPLYANRTIVPADPPTSLFGSSHGGHEVCFSMWDGRRLTGPGKALIADRDGEGRFRTWTFDGAVVPLPDRLGPLGTAGNLG
jgi:hypothetical protein